MAEAVINDHQLVGFVASPRLLSLAYGCMGDIDKFQNYGRSDLNTRPPTPKAS